MPDNTAFNESQKKIGKLLTEEFQRNQLKLSQLMALLLILSQARNEDELVMLVHLFVDEFSALQDFVSEKKKAGKMVLEQEVEQIVKKMVADNPAQAAEIAKTAMEEGMDATTLLERYPEMKKYKN